MEEDDGIVYFTVEKNVPIPSREAVPLDEMEVGDSIAFPDFKRKSVQSKASLMKKRGEAEFTVRKIDDTTCRIWRTN